MEVQKVDKISSTLSSHENEIEVTFFVKQSNRDFVSDNFSTAAGMLWVRRHQGEQRQKAKRVLKRRKSVYAFVQASKFHWLECVRAFSRIYCIDSHKLGLTV